MEKKKIFAVCMIAVVLFTLSGCGQRVVDTQQIARNEKIVIKFSHVVAENTPKGMAAERFADLVRERTGGYVEVQVFPDSLLYKDGEEMEALKNGKVQMIAPATAKLSDIFPPWQVLDLPFAFSDINSVHAFMDGPAGKELISELKSNKLLGLAVWDNGFKQVTNGIRSLIKPEDFRGITFRVMNSHVLEDQFNTLGAYAVPIHFNAVFNALAWGNVNGEENTISNIYSRHFDRVQQYLTVSNHGYIGYVVLTNADFWNSLPPWVRKVLEETLADVTQWERDKAVELNNEQLEAMKRERYLTIHELNASERSEWQRALLPVYDHLAKKIGPYWVDRIKMDQIKD